MFFVLTPKQNVFNPLGMKLICGLNSIFIARRRG